MYRNVEFQNSLYYIVSKNFFMKRDFLSDSFNFFSINKSSNVRVANAKIINTRNRGPNCTNKLSYSSYYSSESSLV